MNERDGYGFCPKCGALMQDGVCRSCGYSVRGIRQTESVRQDPFTGQTAGPGWQEPTLTQTPGKKKSGHGRVIALVCAVTGVLCLIGIICFMICSIRRVVNEVQNEVPGYGYGSDDGYFGYGNPYENDWYDSDDTYDYYEPDENDDYYKEITDATSQDLDYKVIWGTLSLRPDDDDDACTYDCVYPVLTGDGAEEKFTAMNQAIEDMVCKYKDTYQEYESGVSSYGYVTCMDEDKISVVVRHSMYGKKTTTPRVEAVSFRIDTGEIISHDEMIQVNEELVWQFRSRNTYQNGTVDFVEELSDEELMEYLKNEEESVMFYTPVGLEIGFNYDGGWVTVTLKTSTL